MYLSHLVTVFFSFISHRGRLRNSQKRLNYQILYPILNVLLLHSYFFLGYTSTENTVGLFILQCLLRVPEKICVSFANQLFLEPLGQVLGSSKSKQTLIQLCRTQVELSQLIQLGCLLGIQEWIDVVHRKCQLPDTAVRKIPTEAVEEFFEDDVIQVIIDKSGEKVKSSKKIE